MNHTLRERLEAGLIALGYNQVADTTKRATRWTTKVEHIYYFVGRNGSLRIGKTYTQSTLVSDLFRQLVLKLGDDNLWQVQEACQPR